MGREVGERGSSRMRKSSGMSDDDGCKETALVGAKTRVTALSL